jgi:hypothetical protein
METIGNSALYTFLSDSAEIASAANTRVRADAGYRVKSYMELAQKIAELQFRNKEHVLLFRGQSEDYRNQKNNSSLKPSILRGGRSNPEPNTLSERFDRLRLAEAELASRYQYNGASQVKRQRIVRWSIIQHYEICSTPLLDLTHSLRVAASFASIRADKEAYVFVLGVPHLSGALTASAEAGIQIARLASMCPPIAMRPHIQEGYLVGEYPDLGEYGQKALYHHHEVDFGRRLVAKFRFDPGEFWKLSRRFPKLAATALTPAPSEDPFFSLAQEIKNRISYGQLA